jgi:DNA-binding transcriptional regulator YhcF (GntR family)
MAKSRPEISAAELETLVLDVVAREARPVTATEIHRAMPKALRPAAKALTGIVATLADAKRLFRIGRRYAGAPDRSLHARIVAVADGDALSAAEIAKKLGAPATRVREAIRELVAAGELHAYPKQHRVIRYATHAPTAADLLQPELARLLANAEKLGIAEPEARRALRELLGGARTADGGEPIVAAIRDLERDADDGALVYLPHLRTALAATYKDKPSFDAAMLRLLARGTIQMQSHPTPSLLGSAERDAMIEDGRGGYFSAAGLR